ncbi:minor capsid protein [Chrysochromulina parva virophage Moe]|nr:minor capsid protein [Chrysochromulina parva virophage Moe]
MASAPRFEGQEVVNAINLYIDSERPNIVGDKQSRGDNVHYNFEGQTIECRDGEVMKISLVDFYMPNNFYNVELKNSFARIRLKGSSTGIKTNDLHNYTIIERGNYYDVQDVATNFAYTLGNVIAGLDPSAGNIHKITNNSLVTQTTALVEIQVGGGGAINQGVWPLLPEQAFDSTGAGATHYPTTNALIQTGRPDKKLLDVTIEFQHAHTLTELYISCQTANGESYLLLGGERGDDSSDISHNSFLIDLAPTIPSDAGAGKCVRVRGYFPMQLTSEPHVYLRTTLGQNGLESAILARDSTNYNSEIIGSDILAKIPRNLDSFAYNANGNTEDFFIYYQQRKLNQIRLYLTDSKGRPIGRAGVTDAQFNFGTGTAAGLESTPPSIPPLTTDRTTFVKTTQNTQGNMYFTSTLKIQIIKKSSPQLLETPMIPFPKVPSKASGVVSFGDKYGKDP